MIIKDVDLHFGNKSAYISLLFIFFAVSFIAGFSIKSSPDTGFIENWEFCLFSGVVIYGVLNICSFTMIHGLIIMFLSRIIHGDPIIKFRAMYGDLFAHTPINIDSVVGVDNYVNAICYDGEFLYVIQKNKMVTLKWSDVRRWEWSVYDPAKQTTTGFTPGAALQGMVQDAAANLSHAVKTATENGISLTVKSLDYPVWFFCAGLGKQPLSTCQKWEEIFRQFDDGTLAIAR
ncbi:hypothetical protein [Gluconacetobacter diazotrophicus]|uniref:hypothetical protein n=1 Tax=Gluconacetobacter diazotrophicus TaxID=33996 RepID=UPI0011994F85|nr:hypothetical protein [Gluconacetobacter diazotrophicus]TWB05636.1 hypothetical protein FBZ86_11563 [Gluconacetobacter diazotrophicus]